MTITKKVVEERDLTIFTIVGESTFDQQMEVLRAFYEAGPTVNVIWDIRGLAGERISSRELREILEFLEQQKEKRPTGKTAFITATDLDFGLSRMGKYWAEARGVPWQMDAFHSLEEAIEWIEEPS